MRIIHLTSGSLDSGAGKGAYRLHKGLLSLGVDSTIVGDNRCSLQGDNIIDTSKLIQRFKRRANVFFDRPRRKSLRLEAPQIYSTGNDVFDVFSHIDLSQFDIIHMHWINFSLSIRQIERVAFQNNVIWTMRDMWQFTGGCHYSLDCDRYKRGCGSCPALGSLSFDASSEQIQLKKQAWSAISFVAISDWLKTEALSSGIVTPNQIETIYNSVDTDAFSPCSNESEPNCIIPVFGNDKPIIAVGALNLMDAYKGGGKLIEALNLLKLDHNFLCFGANATLLMSQVDGATYHDYGLVNESLLAEIYRKSDVFLMLSVQEAFGKTVIESVSCGTPVVCFANTGPSEIIEKLGSVSGISVSSVEEIPGAIDQLISIKRQGQTSELLPILRDHFSNEAVSRQYYQLYCTKLGMAGSI